MFDRLKGIFGNTDNNATQAQQDKTNGMGKKPRGKPVTLEIKDRHEPFGAISIEKIKLALDKEDFAELQALYFYMMRDLKIASTVLSRRQPLLGLDYIITSDNEQFLDWATDNLNLDDLITQLSFAVYYGISLIDVGYAVKDGKLVPSFRQIPPRYLHANVDKTLKTTKEHLYIKQGTNKRFIDKLEADKHVFHKHAIDIGEITDFSLASKLVWYFSLKHMALAHNMQFFDAVATPPLIGKTEGDEKALIDAMYQLKSASVGVVGKDDVLEFLNVSEKAEFLAFIEYIDRQIATLVLGNTLSTGEGSKGSYSQSKVHENRQRETLEFDAKLIAKTIGHYLTQLEKLNFANPKGVTFAFDLSEESDLKELSEVVKNLSTAGFELDTQDIEDRFGFKVTGFRAVETSAMPDKDKVQDKNTMLQTNNNIDTGKLPCGCSIEHNTAKPLDALDEQEQDTTALEAALLVQVEKILADASNYEDAYDALLDAYPDFDLTELEAALFKAVANSDLHAETEAS